MYDLTNEDFMKTLEPSALSGVTVKGRVIGYPFLVQSHSFIYNKKIFADAGITTLPRTITEYEAVAKKLQAKGIQPFATGFKEWWVLPQTAWQVLAPIKDSFGGDYANFVDKLNSGSLKFKNIKEMNTVFDVLDLIKKYGGPKPHGVRLQRPVLAAGHGQGRHDPPGELGGGLHPEDQPGRQHRFPPRTGRQPRPPRPASCIDSNQTIRVAKDGQNLQAALAWLRWLTTSDYGKKWIPDQIKQLSPIKGVEGLRRPAVAGHREPPRREDSRLSLVLPDVPRREPSRDSASSSRATARDRPTGSRPSMRWTHRTRRS